MVHAYACALLGLAASTALGAKEDPYYANETFLPPRTLNVGSNLTVQTQTGTFIGMYNDTYPNVRQFLRVPFAQPPVGDLRWRPPQRLNIDPTKIIDSTRFGPNCAQYVPAGETFWNEYAPTNQVSSLGQQLDDNQVSWSSAEDCLTLAVWTPSYANATSRLPVSLFVSGGGMVTGGVDIPSQLPTNWVSNSQEHVAITINYRLNIFGNPIARALNNESFQLQDVRAAVEWAYENIAAFGGDPDNIFLWGQSAGATLTHYYTLAYPDHPLATHFGVISSTESEAVGPEQLEVSNVYDQFDTLSKAMGCDYGTEYDAQLSCMRSISWVQISEYINRFNFTPEVKYNFAYLPPDDVYIFSNESDRYAQGLVAPGPMIRSDALRERPSDNITEVMENELNGLCYSLADAVRRKAAGLETYKYMWAGNFSNISPVPWLGAFHWSDLLMIMGTFRTDAAPGSTIPQLEVDTSRSMQDYFLAFTKDPSTLPSIGWQLFDANATDGGVVLEFGNGTTVANNTGNFFWGACNNLTDFVPTTSG